MPNRATGSAARVKSSTASITAIGTGTDRKLTVKPNPMPMTKALRNIAIKTVPGSLPSDWPRALTISIAVMPCP